MTASVELSPITGPSWAGATERFLSSTEGYSQPIKTEEPERPPGPSGLCSEIQLP